MPAPSPATTPESEFLRKLRGSKTQEEFAAMLGVKQPTISKVETGHRGITPELGFRLIIRGVAKQKDVERFVDLRGYFPLAA